MVGYEDREYYEIVAVAGGVEMPANYCSGNINKSTRGLRGTAQTTTDNNNTINHNTPLKLAGKPALMIPATTTKVAATTLTNSNNNDDNFSNKSNYHISRNSKGFSTKTSTPTTTPTAATTIVTSSKNGNSNNDHSINNMTENSYADGRNKHTITKAIETGPVHPLAVNR